MHKCRPFSLIYPVLGHTKFFLFFKHIPISKSIKHDNLCFQWLLQQWKIKAALPIGFYQGWLPPQNGFSQETCRCCISLLKSIILGQGNYKVYSWNTATTVKYSAKTCTYYNTLQRSPPWLVTIDQGMFVPTTKAIKTFMNVFLYMNAILWTAYMHSWYRSLLPSNLHVSACKTYYFT